MRLSGILKRLSFVMAGLITTWLLFALFFDPGPAGDSDLRLPSRTVDPAQNPFPEIRELELSEAEMEELTKVGSMFNGKDEFDEALLLDLLERHRSALAQFDRYAAMGDWCEDQPLNSSMNFDYLNVWFGIAQLKRAEAARLAFEGKNAEAVAAAVSMLRFGAGLESSRSPMLAMLIANKISQDGTSCLASLLERIEMDGDGLAPLAESLNDHVFDRSGLEEGLRAEFEFIVSSSMDWEQFEELMIVYPYRTRQVPKALGYKENRTRTMTADFYRSAILSADRDLRTLEDAVTAAVPKSERVFWSNLLSGNGIGLESVWFGSNSVFGVVRQSFLTRAQRSLVRTRVAMQRYRLDHGAWPEMLESLVGKYLDALPVDPMDGKLLRYNALEKALYSVGTDFIDKGGIYQKTRGNFKSTREIAIFLELTEPSPWPDFSADSKSENPDLKSPPSPESRSPGAQKAPSQRRVPLP